MLQLIYLIPKLTGDDIENKNNFKVLITDGAPYCVKLGKDVKKYFNDVKHVICLCHNLHLLAEEIRKQNLLVNLFIVELKKCLIKNKTNISIYKKVTSLPPIKFPIITRWGTFINCANFIYLNITVIMKFINNLDTDSKHRLLNIANSPGFISELFHVSEQKFIANTILKLESLGLTLAEQLNEFQNIKQKLNDQYLIDRFLQIESKNPDLNYFLNFDSNSCTFFNYLNLTTVQVERSFSFLRTLLSEKRRSISSKNIFGYLSPRNNSYE